MLKLINVSKKFGDKNVVDNASFVVNKGDNIVITGPSGSGKSTLLRLIAGLDRINEGEIFINEQLISSEDFNLPPYKRSIAMVFQSPALWPHMTVRENILFAMEHLKDSDKEKKLHELLQFAEITELKDRYPNQISGGEARRVSILRAIASDKEIIFLDEPLTNLNEDIKYKLLDFILKLVKEEKKTMIIVTHDKAEADRITGRSFYMEKGKITEV